MKFDDLTNGQTKAVVAKCGGVERAIMLLQGKLVVVPAPKRKERSMKVLRPVDPPASPPAFKADETFFAKKTGVKIEYRGKNFRSWFAGAVEENPSSAPLSVFNLTESSRDIVILEDLGGEENAAVTLSQIWWLMQQQPSGQEGRLRTTNEWANIFYCYDKNGVLRSVFVYWQPSGWYVDALALGTHLWNEQVHVFSRDS